MLKKIAEFFGMQSYEDYVEQCKKTGQTPMSKEEFEKQKQSSKPSC